MIYGVKADWIGVNLLIFISVVLSLCLPHAYCNFMYHCFIFQINIDSPAREAITRNIQKPTQSCFDEAQKIVYMHMERDSYPRFLGSDIYQKLKLQTDRNDSLIH